MADPLENQISTNEEEENNFLTGLENSEFKDSQHKKKKSENDLAPTKSKRDLLKNREENQSK